MINLKSWRHVNYNNEMTTKFSISFFFTVFNENITRMWQFISNEQILHKHVKNEENTDFYTDFRWCTDFYMDLWVYGFIRIFNFWKNGILPLSSGNTASSSTPREDRHMRSRTFLFKIQFRTTFIWNFFRCDAYSPHFDLICLHNSPNTLFSANH